MKTYEEMTRSVMEKAQKRKAAQKRRNNIVLTAASFCLIMVSAVLLGRLNGEDNPDFTQDNPIGIIVNGPTQNTNSTQELTPRFTLLCASKDGQTPKVMTERIRVPYRAEIRVRDVTGMTEDERQEVLAAENAYVQEFSGESPDESGYSRYCRDNVIVTLLQEGMLSIVFDDIETLARAQISVTTNGYIFYPRFSGIRYKDWDENGLTVEVDGDSVRKGLEMLGTDSFDMIWNLSPDLSNRLDEDPDMDLTQFSDRITIQIDYTDGWEEISVIHMEVDSTGKVYAVLDETVING